MVFETGSTLAVGERGEGSGDGCWLLVWKNGIDGGGEGFLEAKRESAAHRERAVTVLFIAFRLHLELIVPAFLSNISPSLSRQLWFSR